MGEFARVEIEDGVATVLMDRPPVNAQNAPFRQDLIETFDGLGRHDEVRSVLLSSSLHVFCAGADFRETSPDDAPPSTHWARQRLNRETVGAIRDCAKPVVAAVNGAALGAGFGLAAACDIIVASESATFGMPEIDIGRLGDASMLRGLFGRSVGREILFTGRRVTAAEMFRLGAISACVPDDELMVRARELAASLAAKSASAMRYAKLAYNTIETMPDRDAYRFCQEMSLELSHTPEAREARRAVQGKADT